ncbi:MAG: glycoside hydrolase family 3 C-terminal domain-containing protein [Chloroflexi bacterium]|nr:glycoside hydrolase family 3 C-terminal domain-containing protein [Chloroflexota bacterium]
MTDIENLITQMTLDEKISMLAGADLWHSIPVKRLGIPAFKVTDGPNGGRGAMGGMGPSSVCTPVGVALGATWNVELVEQIGNVLGDEVKSKGAHILLAPTVNIHRSPIAGRNFECYSEDPYLSGEMATAYIKGIQNRGVGTCIKHFVCNDQEFERMSMSSEVEERPLRELYLEPFRKAIKNAHPWSVMSAYNRVRGSFASENTYTLKTILKDEWGFEGPVISDWYGTYSDNVPTGGLDLEMPGPARWMNADKVRSALANGTLTETELSDKVRRLLKVIEKAGLFQNPELQPERGEDRSAHREIIRSAAGEAIVLLKNKDGLLPLIGAKSIAVIGENARWTQILGGGSSAVTPHYVISPLEGIRTRAGQQVKVEYAPGCFIHRTMPAPDPDTLSTVNGAQGLFVEIFDNLDFSGPAAFTQVNKHVQFGWFGDCVPNVDQSRFSVRLSGFFSPKETGKHAFGLGTVGRGKLFIDNKEVIDNWLEPAPYGQKTTELDMLAGQKYAVKVEYNWDGNPLWRSLSFSHMPPHAPDLLAEAVELASRSDVVILVAGLTGEWEAEGFDRLDMKLPGNQDELIARVTAANPNTIVVLNSGSPVEMPWVDEVSSILQIWYDSQEQGNALADVLFGDVTPSGKLPTTFPRRLQDNPAYINFPGENGKVYYGEGLFVGYRYYDKKAVEPLFPFGHGLSYTTFEYKNLLVPESFKIETGLTVRLDVKNTGKCIGKEIIQVYVRDVRSSLVRPEKELKSFCKIELQPGESKTIKLNLDKEAFWFYDPARGGWITEPGEFEIMVGASCQDIRLIARSMLAAAPMRHDTRLHTGMALRTVLNDPAGYAAFAKHFREWIKAPELQNILDMTIDEIATFAPNIVTPEKLFALSDDLAKV